MSRSANAGRVALRKAVLCEALDLLEDRPRQRLGRSRAGPSRRTILLVVAFPARLFASTPPWTAAVCPLHLV